MGKRYTVKTEAVNLTDAQKKTAANLGISDRFLSLLLGRGFSEEDIYDYLNPSVGNLSSPQDIDGMQSAVERIQRAIDGKERILVYGDYDCDGICAVSILMLFLRDKADINYFIPDRARDGYGMSVSSLDRVLTDFKPNLIISVDCGITAVKEAEYLKSHGVDLIVTDHHEPQKEIPDCIVVNPKIAKRGFYELCGAGVALKLVEALSDRSEACKYLDIAAIATIADVVPLKEDNRIIAYFGIEQIKRSPRKGIKLLLGEDEISSQNIMYRLAPRMNAAGRLNSASKVVGLFLESDYFMLKTLAEELCRDNALRQELCEQTAKEAKDMLKGRDFTHEGMIALYSEKWEAGVLGIAAAKLVEEFKRPTVLFAKKGDALKGSARSIYSVNIFDVFSSLSGYFTSFGGHSQAAGVSLDLSNFEAFKRDADKLVLSTHSPQEFIPQVRCEMEIPLDFDYLSFARELEKMEPTGYGNSRPDFLIKADGLKFDTIGYSRHVKCCEKNLDLLGFNNYADVLSARTGKVELEVALDINCFRNIVRAQGIIRSLSFDEVRIEEDDAACLNLHHYNYDGGAYVTKSDISEVIDIIGRSPFGTIIVCFSQKDYDNICALSDEIRGLPVFIGNKPELNPQNCVVVCPSADFEYAFYENAVIAGAPLYGGYLSHIAAQVKRCIAVADTGESNMTVSDAELRAVYKAFVQVAMSKLKAANLHSLYLLINERVKIEKSRFLLATKIFGQLGLVRIGEKGALNISRKSVDLDDSPVYRKILHG